MSKVLLAMVLASTFIGCTSGVTEFAKGVGYYENELAGFGEGIDFDKEAEKAAAISYDEWEVFTDAPKGYEVTFPKGSTYDLSLSEYVVTAQYGKESCTLSVERSPYSDVDGYLEFYQNRFYTNEYFREQNGITLHEDTTIETAGMKTKIITISKEHFGVYTYAYQHLGGRSYMRYMFQGESFDEGYAERYMKVLNSYNEVAASGRSASSFVGSVVPNPNWSDETVAVYEGYMTQTDIDWGIFVADVYNDGINRAIPEMEEKIGVDFEVVLMYNQLGTPVSGEALEKAHDDGKMIEFTLQVSAKNNEDVYGYTPMFDLLEGKLDAEIRELATTLKNFENPILFRLNNEMNSDWTSYSGIVTFSDPEIYKDVWKYIYEIFEQEGVDNCIWVFNPNDNNYPPSRWNHFTRYYPGDGYVHMIGVTGYNTGTYYRYVTGETWRDFDEIYDEVEEKYSVYFDSFPWIITEFGSSSIGGDKVKWIEEMFENIEDYENIKVAVWFSYADFDVREGKNGAVARPYWLDETEDTLAAFAEGRKALLEREGEE